MHLLCSNACTGSSDPRADLLCIRNCSAQNAPLNRTTPPVTTFSRWTPRWRRVACHANPMGSLLVSLKHSVEVSLWESPSNDCRDQLICKAATKQIKFGQWCCAEYSHTVTHLALCKLMQRIELEMLLIRKHFFWWPTCCLCAECKIGACTCVAMWRPQLIMSLF